MMPYTQVVNNRIEEDLSSSKVINIACYVIENYKHDILNDLEKDIDETLSECPSNYKGDAFISLLSNKRISLVNSYIDKYCTDNDIYKLSDSSRTKVIKVIVQELKKELTNLGYTLKSKGSCNCWIILKKSTIGFKICDMMSDIPIVPTIYLSAFMFIMIIIYFHEVLSLISSILVALVMSVLIFIISFLAYYFA